MTFKDVRKKPRKGDYLIVGISSDELNRNKKGKNPIFSCKERVEIIS